jgi:hypothetical protein
MSTTKTVLLLLAILGANGIVGRMDYDDAVELESAQMQAIHPDGPVADSTPLTSTDSKQAPSAIAERAEEPEPLVTR